MAHLVLLISGHQDEVSLSPRSVEALARLGVTSVSVARDEQAAAIVLEGWALDPSQHAQALAALGTSANDARVLQPVAQMAVAPTNPGGT